MKNAFLFTILSIFFPFVSIACLPDGITFSNQSEIDNFPIDYPDCDVIEGNVIISGTDIINLNGLLNIEIIEGDLIINNNNELNDLNGLNNLITIEGGVECLS